MMLTLISGGARSGKSRHALELAAGYEQRIFIATAQAFDDEMKRRIVAHQEEREGAYRTVEAPHDPARVLTDLPSDTEVVVLDCLTLWLGNLMYEREQAEAPLSSNPDDYPAVGRFLDLIDTGFSAGHGVDLLIVTNELGLGLVPADAMSRAFRDLAGRLNQELARRAQRVLFMVCGLPMVVKDLSTSP